ncbi:MAG: hypothetical protein IPQ18_09800 [Saprospiraceae bacterium]|jgi:hypothetical protein|nr:hypothetical protein [Saprospiraceae bacterium]
MKHKIYLSLTDAKYKTLKAMLQTDDFGNVNTLTSQFAAKENGKQLLKLSISQFVQFLAKEIAI